MRLKINWATSRSSNSSAVGVVQMCYNTQNLVGTGCYERDGGLSGFGREVVAEMNRVGIMCDLSRGFQNQRRGHPRIEKPVCYSHCLPSGLKDTRAINPTLNSSLLPTTVALSA